MVICWLQTAFHAPSLTPCLCSPSKAAPQLVLAQVKPSLKKGKDLLMGLLKPLKTWQVTGTNKHVNRLTEDRNCWTFDLSNLNQGETWLEQYTDPNPGSTGSLLQGRQGWGKMLMPMRPVLLWRMKSVRKGVAITKQKNGYLWKSRNKCLHNMLNMQLLTWD